MSYTKQNFAKGQVLKASQLNTIEDGLVAHGDKIDQLWAWYEEKTYTPISINTFKHNKSNTYEKGTVVTGVTLSWSFNKTPKSLTLNNVTKEVTSTGEEIPDEITTNTTWTLKATGDKNETATKSTSISFLNGVYYGVGVMPEEYTNDFILGLTRELRSSIKTSITVNAAGDNDYIWYCVPTSFGKCAFKINGFDGGLELVTDDNGFEFTNSSGFMETYYIYKTIEPGLGSTTVAVSKDIATD